MVLVARTVAVKKKQHDDDDDDGYTDEHVDDGILNAMPR